MTDKYFEILPRDDLADLHVTTCYVKCRCEICKKEFMGFAGSVICSESRCNREWMDKNIHSKIEVARALQKKTAKKESEPESQPQINKDFEKFKHDFSLTFDFNDEHTKAVAWAAWNTAFNLYSTLKQPSQENG